MTLYRDMTPPELVETALSWHGSSRATSRIIYALAARLEQEYQRAELHKNKALDCQRLRIEQEHRLASHIKVAKPHIQVVHTWDGQQPDRPMWRCSNSPVPPFGIVQYGSSPSEAYAAWRRVMERGHGIPCDNLTSRAARFRMNYMRRD